MLNQTPKKAIRVYPKSYYPTEKWLFRIENSDASCPTAWMEGGPSKEQAIEKAKKYLKEEPAHITVENGRYS